MNFGISAQAIAFDAIARECCFGIYASLHSVPWYNKRERGISYYFTIEVTTFYFTVFEAWDSERLICETWEGPVTTNPICRADEQKGPPPIRQSFKSYDFVTALQAFRLWASNPKRDQ